MPCYGAHGKAFEYYKVFGDPVASSLFKAYIQGIEDGFKLSEKKNKEQVRDDTPQVPEKKKED